MATFTDLPVELQEKIMETKADLENRQAEEDYEWLCDKMLVRKIPARHFDEETLEFLPAETFYNYPILCAECLKVSISVNGNNTVDFQTDTCFGYICGNCPLFSRRNDSGYDKETLPSGYTWLWESLHEYMVGNPIHKNKDKLRKLREALE